MATTHIRGREIFVKQRDSDPPLSQQPGWCASASTFDAYLRGLRALFRIPALVLFFTALGYGAYAQDTGLTLFQTTFISLTVFALPGQVVLVDQIAHGASIALASFAVMLTAIRLLPMTVVMLPYLRDGNNSKVGLLLGAHFIAITAWVEGMRVLPDLPLRLRLAHHLGVGSALITSVTLASIAGHILAGSLPAVLSAAFLFLTPVYFTLSLAGTVKVTTDRLAVVFGMVLGPAAYLAFPKFDLLITGLVAGTTAYLIGALLERRKPR